MTTYAPAHAWPQFDQLYNGQARLRPAARCTVYLRLPILLRRPSFYCHRCPPILGELSGHKRYMGALASKSGNLRLLSGERADRRQSRRECLRRHVITLAEQVTERKHPDQAETLLRDEALLRPRDSAHALLAAAPFQSIAQHAHKTRRQKTIRHRTGDDAWHWSQVGTRPDKVIRLAQHHP